jgi:hypothetical protein
MDTRTSDSLDKNLEIIKADQFKNKKQTKYS